MPNYTFEHDCYPDDDSIEGPIIRWELLVPIAKREELQVCPRCESYDGVVRLVGCPAIHFAEVDKPGDSTKPDSYWDNAEQEKQKRIAGEQKVAMEKAYYGDATLHARHDGLKGRIK